MCGLCFFRLLQIIFAHCKKCVPNNAIFIIKINKFRLNIQCFYNNVWELNTTYSMFIFFILTQKLQPCFKHNTIKTDVTVVYKVLLHCEVSSINVEFHEWKYHIKVWNLFISVPALFIDICHTQKKQFEELLCGCCPDFSALRNFNKEDKALRSIV